jgi:hypothetical protein
MDASSSKIIFEIEAADKPTSLACGLLPMHLHLIAF